MGAVIQLPDRLLCRGEDFKTGLMLTAPLASGNFYPAYWWSVFTGRFILKTLKIACF